jgi:hypothetical protein
MEACSSASDPAVTGGCLLILHLAAIQRYSRCYLFFILHCKLAHLAKPFIAIYRTEVAQFHDLACVHLYDRKM